MLSIRLHVMVCLCRGYKVVINKLRSYVHICVLNILSNVSLPHQCGVWLLQQQETNAQDSSRLQTNYVSDHITANKNASDKLPETR